MFKRITLGHSPDHGAQNPRGHRPPAARPAQYRHQPAAGLSAAGLPEGGQSGGALALCPAEETEAFIIGGGELFRESLPIADRIYLTVVPLTVPGDTFFPEIPDTFAVTCTRTRGRPPVLRVEYLRPRFGTRDAGSKKETLHMPEDKTYHMSPPTSAAWGMPRSTGSPTTSERVESLPVLSRVKPGEIRAALPAHRPEQGEPFEAMLADVDAHDPARHHPLAVAQFLRLLPGQHLRARRSWAICSRPGSACRACSGPPARPAPSWRRTCWTGWSSMLGPAAAVPLHRRRRRRDPGLAPRAPRCARCWRRASAPPGCASNERGCDGRLVAYTSTQAHSSVEKAVKIAGLGPRQPAPDRGGRRLRHAPGPRWPRRSPPTARPGCTPCFVVRHRRHHLVQRPSTRCRAIGAICREHGLWLHVDARHGRHRRALPGVPPHPRRPGAGRQLLLQPAQVDVHQLRLRLLLRGRPRAR